MIPYHCIQSFKKEGIRDFFISSKIATEPVLW